MLSNIKKNGVESQLKLYGSKPGSEVTKVYNKDLSDEENLSRMISKIYELGPQTVSKHCADSSKLNVVDVSRSKLSDKDAFLSALQSNSSILKYIDEPSNGCVHIEILQP